MHIWEITFASELEKVLNFVFHHVSSVNYVGLYRLCNVCKHCYLALLFSKNFSPLFIFQSSSSTKWISP